MPLSPCRYVVVQQYGWWNCCQNPFTILTLIYGSRDASVNIQYGLHAVRWFSGAEGCVLPATKLRIQSSGWTSPSWTASAYSMWYHESLSPAGSQCGPYMRYFRWCLQSWYWKDGLEIPHTCWWSCLPSCKPLLRQQCSLKKVIWQMCFWDRLPQCRLLVIVVRHDVGIIYWKACV